MEGMAWCAWCCDSLVAAACSGSRTFLELEPRSCHRPLRATPPAGSGHGWQVRGWGPAQSLGNPVVGDVWFGACRDAPGTFREPVSFQRNRKHSKASPHSVKAAAQVAPWASHETAKFCCGLFPSCTDVQTQARAGTAVPKNLGLVTCRRDWELLPIC